MDECRAALHVDEPDCWRRGWCDTKALCPRLVRCLQGGGGIMFGRAHL